MNSKLFLNSFQLEVLNTVCTGQERNNSNKYAVPVTNYFVRRTHTPNDSCISVYVCIATLEK